MSDPSAGAGFWSALIELNKVADSLIEKCQRAVEPLQPTTREIPFTGSIEAIFNKLPVAYGTAPVPNSDALAGNNIKRPVFTNGGSRVYVREISFQTWRFAPLAIDGSVANVRATNQQRFPFNFRWNFETSITQRRYSQNGRCLAAAGGRPLAGDHISFMEPLVIEPRETLTFECELLSFGMQSPGEFSTIFSSAIVAMYLSGYREAM